VASMSLEFVLSNFHGCVANMLNVLFWGMGVTCSRGNRCSYTLFSLISSYE